MRKIRTQSLHFFIFYFSVSSHHGSGASLWCPNIRFDKIWRKFQGELTGYQAVSILAACYQPVSAISQVSALAIDWRGDDGRHIRSQVSHFFPFQIRTSPSKAFLRDFPLFSNGSLFFSPDNLYKKLDWLGLCRKRLVLRQLRLTALCRPEGENSHQRTKSSLSNRPSISSVNLKQITITLVPFVGSLC